jgi:thioredoxin-like negative regulator of GroEL
LVKFKKVTVFNVTIIEKISITATAATMENILELTDSNYVSFIENNNSVVFIDFYSDTCAPCQTLLTYLPSLAQHYEAKEVVIAKVNVALNPKLANKFMVKSVPLVLPFDFK